METSIVYRHPKGRFDVVERHGRNIFGEEYRIREAVATPRRDQRGLLHTADAPEMQPVPQGLKKQQKKVMGERELEEIKQLFRGGKSIRAIAAETGFSISYVRDKLNRAGVRKPKFHRLWTDEEVTLAKKLRAQGWTLVQIGERIGRSEFAVAARLAQAPVALRPQAISRK